LVEVDFSPEAIQYLEEGKADAYISSLMAGHYMGLVHGFPNIIVSAPTPFDPNSLEIAVRKDMPELASIITKTIANIRPEEHETIRSRWLSIEFKNTVDYPLLWQILAGAGLIFVGFIFWNRLLRRKVAERTLELTESEARFRATFEQAAVGVAHVSLEGKFQRINSKFSDIVGYSEDEMLDLTFQDISHTDDLETDLWYLKQLLQGEIDNYSMEKRYYRKDGSVVWIHLTVSLMIDRGGNPDYFVSVIKDISDRKQAEDALRLSFDFQQHLNTTVPDAVFSVKMPERIIEWANDSYDVLGYESEESVGESPEMFYASPEESQAVRTLLSGLIREGKDVLRMEAMLRHKNGRIFPAEINAAVYKENGEVVSVTSLVRDITERKQTELDLNNSLNEVKRLKELYEEESMYLREEIKLVHNFENIIGQSEGIIYVLNRVEQVAPLDSTVLILGETGTGKELVARAIHKLSTRSERPLVKVNCAALPGELIESELFGREKGAFTGATTTQIGRFELAKGSSLFLDEIGELPLDLQAKLLRVLESGEFERLGSSRSMHSDARIIAATNRDLEEEVRNGRFREDLLYRLKIFPITLPPLRDRLEDIPLLVTSFVQSLSRKMGKSLDVKLDFRR